MPCLRHETRRLIAVVTVFLFLSTRAGYRTGGAEAFFLSSLHPWGSVFPPFCGQFSRNAKPVWDEISSRPCQFSCCYRRRNSFGLACQRGYRTVTGPDGEMRQARNPMRSSLQSEADSLCDVDTLERELGRSLFHDKFAELEGERTGFEDMKDRQDSPRTGKWPESPGEDVPFECASLHETATFPCSIQLVPRAEGASMMYVNGTIASVSRREERRRAEAARITALAACQDLANVSQGKEYGLESRLGEQRGEGQRHVQDRRRGQGQVQVQDLGQGQGHGQQVDEAGKPGEGMNACGSMCIRLVGEMAVPRPAYLQVHQGGVGQGDTLCISQFGLARGGSVACVELVPGQTPVVATPGGSTRFPWRTGKPRLKEVWAGPLLWPNEVNQVPPEAVARLIGKPRRKWSAEHVPPVLGPGTGESNLRWQSSDNGGGGSGGGDGYEGPWRESHCSEGTGLGPGAWQEARVGSVVGKRAGAGAGGDARAEKEAGDCGWSPVVGGGVAGESLGPEQVARAALVADGFLMPGKADGGVYAVLPGGGDASVDQSMGKHREYGENIVMLTGVKR